MDETFFDWFPPDQGGGVKEQNHLSKDTSHYILNGLTRSGAHEKVIVLNGHDHEGCDTYHYLSPAARQPDTDSATETPDDTHAMEWNAHPYHLVRSDMANDDLVGVREITVRSMMGSFGGNAGFLSAWFDRDAGEWNFEYNSCLVGVQHIWWAVHILDLVVLGLGIAWLGAMLLQDDGRPRAKDIKMKKA